MGDAATTASGELDMFLLEFGTNGLCIALREW